MLRHNPAAESNVRRIYARRARRYGFTHSLQTAGLDRLIWRPLVAREANLKNGDVVLDVCTGTALTAIAAAKLARKKGIKTTHVGVDMSPEMLMQAKRIIEKQGLGDRIKLVEAQVGKLPFRNEHFDKVTNMCGLGGVRDQGEAVRDLLRVTRPGGTFVALEMQTPKNGVLNLVHNDVVSPFIGRWWGFRDTNMPKLFETTTWKDPSGDEWRFRLEKHKPRKDLLFGSVGLTVAKKEKVSKN